MAQPIAMPKLGLTMTAGSVAEWKKHEGEFVRKGDILMVVATDKLTYEVEAPADGTLLKILVQAGASVPVGEVLAYIGLKGEEIPCGTAGAERPAQVFMTAAPAPHAAPVGEAVRTPLLASPLARKTARFLGVDLSLVGGSGPGGRVVRKDVVAFSESRGAARQRISPTAAKMATELGVDVSAVQAEGRIMKADILRTQAPAPEPGAGDRRIPMTPMRRVIAERMSLSASTIPAVSYDIEADFGALADFRKVLKEPLEQRGVKLSINHLLMKICARALMEFPMANASKEGNEFVLHGDANIGTAVSVPGGLIVPNVKAVQRKSLGEIATETEALIEKAL
jgi:pyruvate dehydrogenase E2 component (dihydrolipoamide acetyltransferase)